MSDASSTDLKALKQGIVRRISLGLNLLALYPEQILPPFDTKVTGTLRATRAKYQEGLMTYAGLLHHYLTMKNTESWTVRGDQRKALEELYAILLHTSATNAGFEFFVRPWADRDIGQNIMPHGWFAAKYVAMVRNMLVREDESVRYFSVREAARLQTFPDGYRFHGSWSETMRQLGNAVPVMLARIVAASVAERLVVAPLAIRAGNGTPRFSQSEAVTRSSNSTFAVYPTRSVSKSTRKRVVL